MNHLNQPVNQSYLFYKTVLQFRFSKVPVYFLITYLKNLMEYFILCCNSGYTYPRKVVHILIRRYKNDEDCGIMKELIITRFVSL